MNPSLEFAVMTGCLGISKEPIFAGLNNPKMISIHFIRSIGGTFWLSAVRG